MKTSMIGILALAIIIGASFTCRAGYIQKEREGSTVLIENGKLKVLPEETGQTWLIIELNNDRMIMGDPMSKRYGQASFEEYCRTMEQMMERMLEAMAGFMGGSDTGADQEEKPVQVKVVKDGPGGDIAGFKTTKYKIFENKELSEEIWLTDDSALLKELGSLKKIGFLECGGEPSALTSSEEYKKLLSSGWPLKSISYSDGMADVDTDVISMEEKNIPDEEFQIPGGYQKVPFSELFELNME